MLQAQVIEDLPSLSAIENEWKELEKNYPQSLNFFGGWNFVWPYLCVIQPEKWFVIVFRDAITQEMKGVFFWRLFNIETGGKKYRAVKLLGSELVPYLDCSIAKSNIRSVVQLMLNDVLKKKAKIDLVCFWPLHEESLLYQVLLEDLGATPALRFHRYPQNLREIETRGMAYESFSRSKPRVAYKDAQYNERRMQREGSVEFCLIEPEVSLSQVVSAMCDGMSSRFGDQFIYREQPKWKELMLMLAKSSSAQVSSLRFNGNVIASSLSFIHQGRRYLYSLHYDNAYAKYSPGKVLLNNLIKQVFAEQGVFCFGVGDYPYKDAWAQSQGELKAAYVFLNESSRNVLSTIVDSQFVLHLDRV